MKRYSLLLFVIFALFSYSYVLQGESQPVPDKKESETAKENKAVTETWDWEKAMLKVTKQYKGDEGKVVPFGDSITYANQAGRWARFGKGKTEEEKKLCLWMHANKNDKTNGWWLAADDQPHGRSWTAASSITSAKYIKGGFHKLPSLEGILKTHNPQIALILLGTNDLNKSVPPEKYLSNMEAIYKKCLENGTIPVVQTVPPTTWDKKGFLPAYNKGLVKLAKKHKLPLIDVYGEFIKRRPGDTWKGTLVSKDGAHFTHKLAAGPATEDNLNNCGYLLRCRLMVKKAGEIKEKVLDKRK